MCFHNRRDTPNIDRKSNTELKNVLGQKKPIENPHL